MTKLLRKGCSKQRYFYDHECDADFEISRPHGCGRLYQFLIEHKFQTGLRLLQLDVRGRTVLEVCCGSGMITEKFAGVGAAVTGIDLSPASVARAQERFRRGGVAALFLAADAENLSFRDRSFDVVVVHDGLHHLDHPGRAICEMARVARDGILILEPAQAVLTRIAVWLGVAVDVETAGNEVQRLRSTEIAALLRDLGYREVRYKRSLMYYPHRPSQWFRWFDHPLLFAAFELVFAVVNLTVGGCGNKLALTATRWVCDRRGCVN